MTLAALLRECWSAQRDTQQLRLFVESRGLARWMRGLISCLTLVVTAIAILSLGSPSGAQGLVDRAVVVVTIVGGIGWAVRWNVAHWPSFRESVVFFAYADIAIAVVCFLDSSSLAGLSGAGLLVLLGTYATFLLGPRVLLVHVLWCAFTITVLAVKVALDPEYDLTIAVAKAIMLTVVGVVVPLVIELGVHLIRVDADKSLTDPLTGLSNRRGLESRLMLLADDMRSTTTRAAAAHPVAAVIVLDLDKFKAINDELGHNVGDEVLVRVGHSLVRAAGPTAVVTRHGGEEFLVFDLYDDALAALRAARAVRDAVAERIPGPAVTASVGLAMASTTALLHDRRRLSATLTELVDRGDTAMYRAKRSGGHCVAVDGGTARGLASTG
jgi:diguanylate cyclase (GGDEF)-like protein